MASRRRNARIAVLQTLFEAGFGKRGQGHAPEEILQRNIEELGKPDVDTTMAESILKGIQEYEENIRTAVQDNAPQWPLERMDAIARALLIIGTYELLYAEDAPAAVVMNEAIEIAKAFGEEETGKFVNGVLNAVAQSRN